MVNVVQIDDTDQWNKYVDRCTGGTVFHRSEFLEAAASKSNTSLYLLVGKKGEHPVAVCPLFSMPKGPFSFVFSPPPKTGIQFLGPAFMLDPNIKYRRASKTKHSFVENLIEWIDSEINPNYVRLLCQPSFDDTRPFDWESFSSSPKYAHTLDLSPDNKTLLKNFSRDARTSLTEEYRTDYTIHERGVDTIRFIVDSLDKRYNEQNKTYDLSYEYISELYEKLPDGTMKVYGLSIDNELISGRISLLYDKELIFWQGVPKPKRDLDIPVNDLLNWHSLRQAKSEDCHFAYLSGANTKRLWQYKGKFNPDLQQTFEISRSGPITSFVESLYTETNILS